MRQITHEEIIKEYYEQVKDKYPGIEYEQFRKICRSPFEYIKYLIKGTGLPIIMIKHLGKFIPSLRKVRKQIESEKRYLQQNIITQEECDFRVHYLINFIKDYNDEISAEIINDTEGGETID